MCGIGGFFRSSPASATLPDAMIEALRSRGPDARGKATWNSSFVRSADAVCNALVATRLAIIDRSPAANQPLANEAQNIWVAYNGEVYDWKATAWRLSQDGARFRSRSDTEFILRAYERWGIRMVERLRGMFALAILDLRTRELWLVRDRMGQKPLVYSFADGDFAFGSTVRTVAPAIDADRRRLCASSVDAYLAHRYVPAPSTILEGVRRLESGCLLRFDLTQRTLTHERYWTRKPVGAPLAPLFEKTVSDHCASDRPLGLFLSSGVDSTALAAELATGDRDFLAITASFPSSSMDESGDAQSTALTLGIRHAIVPMAPEIGTDFERIVSDLDEPFADPSAIPTWYLCRAASNEVKVALGGEGLDELLAGYKRLYKHLRTAWRERLPHVPVPVPGSCEPKGWSKWLAEASMGWRQSYALRFSGFTPSQRHYFQPDMALPRYTYWTDPSTDSRVSPLDALLDIDLDNYLPEYILRKTDLCGMAHGLELRAPYLDHEWVEAILALPMEIRFTRPPKALMLDVVPGLAATGAIARPKRGFNPPVAPWLRGELRARFAGLGGRLQDLTCGQLRARPIDRFCTRYLDDAKGPAEQLFQLLVLDESLRQIRALA